MDKVTWIIMGFAVLQFLVALVNLLFRQRVPDSVPAIPFRVSVLIPARNEEVNLPELLESLRGQVSAEDEILVFDDGSEDNTAAVVRHFAESDSRIRLLPSVPLPEGWMGKPRGCHLLAEAASGDYFLFLDADVVVRNQIIARSAVYMAHHRLDLLSHFPQQQMKSAGEWSTVPLMHYILLTLLPLILVRRSWFASLSAANGQFMLFRAAAYKTLLPHQAARSVRAEDIFIARLMKRRRMRVACVAGTRDVICRMYNGWEDAVNGFSRNVTAFFGGSYPAAILFWAMVAPGVVWMAFASQGWMLTTYVALFLLTRSMVSLVARQHVLRNLIFTPPQLLAMGWLIYKSFANRIRKRQTWKGRYI
jgi:glycosyltransferase involved in cell wall biosynthesis